MMQELLNKGPDELQAEVQQADLCTGCGMCAGLCPYIKEMEEKVAIIDRCGRGDGRCYQFCPRTFSDLDALDESVFGARRADAVLGSYRSLSMVKSAQKTVQQTGQYGGTVSALLIHALNKGVIDAALLTKYSENKHALPQPAIARNRKEVLSCAGSKYTAAPTLKALQDALKNNKKLAIVGRPCQVTAVRKMQMLDDSPEVKNIALVIGLFCLWALDYKRYSYYLSQQVDLKKIRKIDIPRNDDFIIYTDNGNVRIPIDKIKSFVRPTCQLCMDVTSELADISLGSTEWKDEFNTMLVRSEKGESLVKSAAKAKAIAIQDFPAEREGILREAVLNKKRRVLNELKARGNEQMPLLYLKMNDDHRKWLEGGSR
jgi:coenzyme F420 hydrogenase subunit beta